MSLMDSDVERLLKSTSIIQINRAAQATAFLLFAYDFTITRRQETKAIWSQQWTLPKILFVIVRYYGFIMLLSDAIVSSSVKADSSVCRGWLYFSVVHHIIILGGLVNLLFLVRMCALYGRTWLVVVILGTLYIAEITANVTDKALNPPRPMITHSAALTVAACLNGAPPRKTAMISQGLCLLRSTLYFMLMLWKWYEYQTSGVPDRTSVVLRSMGSHGHRRRLTPLLSLLVRDEAVIFMVVTMLQIIMTVFVMSPKSAPLKMYTGAVSQWFMASLMICALRLVLNLRNYLDGPRASTAPNVSLTPSAAPIRVGMHRTQEVIVSDATSTWPAEHTNVIDIGVEDADHSTKVLVQDEKVTKADLV